MRERIHFFDQVSEVRKMPTWVISDVIVNDQLRQGSNSPTAKWLSPDYVLENAAYFSFATKGGPYRGQTPTMHRGLINEVACDLPYLDEFGNAYSIVSSKGVGLSQYSLQRRGRILVDSDTGKESFVSINLDPHGFFGYRHARQDMSISNDLSEAGGRVSRGVAILVIDHSNFRQWAELYLKNSNYPCLEMLDRVEANGDIAAILVRMFAADRFEDALDSPSVSRSLKRKAALTLCFEIESRGIISFVEKYQLDRYSNFDIEPIILKLFEENDAEGDFSALQFFQAYFNIWNARVKQEVSDKKYNGKLTVQINRQNMDITGGWSDFEASIFGDQQFYSDSYWPLTFASEYEGVDFFGKFDKTKFVARRFFTP